MDDPNASVERSHLTWRDLPPTPPLGPMPAMAMPAAGAAPVTASPRRSAPRRRTLAAIAVGTLATALIIGSVAVTLDNNGSGSDPAAALGPTPTNTPAPNQGTGSQPDPSTAPQQQTNPGPNNGMGGTGTDPGKPEPYADTAAKLLPSVVQIETQEGLGSGFVADSSGLILTAGHVVGSASQVTVRLPDGSTTPGTVVGVDTSVDSAVVKIDRTDIPALTLADSDKVRVGQIVIAVGSPFGLDQTVTNGIVSALNRSITTEVGPLSGLIQTDAPINPGN
ncbi:MAG TPA: trypsin-like peptidase domain-containing protein, partial [Candidatus Binatia bacterium]|nr:trypsin-like peptidase domain-containing protein [Candidatus Binatia bacterium]